CHDALWETGDHAAAARELDRLRALFGGPQLYLAVSLRAALAAGDAAAAARLYEAMLPGERTLTGLFAARRDARALPAGLRTGAAFARDAPTALAPLLRAAGEDPTAPFNGVAEQITATDRKSPILPSAATAILAHIERYDVEPSGLTRFVMLDV